MKFMQLIEAEFQAVRNTVIRNYQKSNFAPVGPTIHWSPRLLNLYNSLPEKLRTNYEQVVSSLYKLTPEEFLTHFGDEKESVQNNGLYLYHAKSNAYLPPEELISVIVPDSLAAFLCSLNKDCITMHLPDELKLTRKEELVATLVRESDKYFSWIKLENRDEILAELMNLESPFNSVIEQSISIYEHSARKAMAILRGANAPDRIRMDKLPEPCAERLGKYLKNGVLFYKPSSHEICFRMHPMVKLWYQQQKFGLLEKKKEQILSQPEPLLKKGPILLHCDPTSLLRKATLLAGGVANHEIEFTMEFEPKKVNLSKFIKGFINKDLVNIEQTTCLSILNVFKTLDIIDWTGGFKIDEKKLFSLTEKQLQDRLLATIDLKISRAVLDSLPLDKWISIESFVALDEIAQQIINGDVVRNSESSIFNAVCLLSAVFGELDIAFSADKAPVPSAVRRVIKSKAIPKNDQLKIGLLSNFEIPIPPDLSEEKVFKLTMLMSVKDLYTLVLDSKILKRFQAEGLTPKEYLKRLPKALNGDVPDIAKTLVGKSLVEQDSVTLLDVGFPILVQSDAHADLVRANFKGKIISEHLNRVFLISTDRFSRIETKFKSLGIPTLSEAKKQGKSEREIDDRFDLDRMMFADRTNIKRSFGFS